MTSVCDQVSVPLYEPAPAALSRTQWTDFTRMCERETGDTFPDVTSLHAWSVREPDAFWDALLRWSAIVYDGSRKPVRTDKRCEFAKFFPHVNLNYAENLLYADPARDDKIAVTACHFDGHYEQMTRRELRRRVCAVAAELSRAGVGPGDRVVAIIYNNIGAIIAALATAAVGGTFASASPEMGSAVILSRFAQLSPKVLMAHGQPSAELRRIPLVEKLAEVTAGLPSLTTYVALDEAPVPSNFTGTCLRLSEIPAGKDPETWARFPFNQPLFILFSSGTSGLPKCIIHGAGGTLLEHQKEQRLHGDLAPDDIVFCQTSTAWMVWNWQLSALACSSVVLFDGPISGPETLWRVVAQHGVTVFGTSPAYLKLCESCGFSPKRAFSLSRLRVVQSRGSILYDRQYAWAHENIGPIPLQSISGGTDILGCFVSGNPNLPVYSGESQCRSLGMDVQALTPNGVSHGDGSGHGIVGELICRNPFPSRPLGLFGDLDGSRFHDAYFSQNPGVWTHGDLIEFTPSGGARMRGRSDSLMKVNGIRVGPAEIYRIIDSFPELEGAMAIEQRTPGAVSQSRMVLLIVLRQDSRGDPQIKVRLCKELASKGSRAHVPDLIVEVDELPATFNGKPSERAARDALNGERIANRAALKNPGSLDHIRERTVEEEKRLTSLSIVEAAPVAEKIRLAWERTLGLREVDPDDSFFDLGGTSLMSARLCQNLNDELGVTIGPWILFLAPTLRRLSLALARPDLGVSPIVPLGSERNGRPVFMIPGMYGDVMELRALANAIGSSRPLYGLRARGLAHGETPMQRVEDIAREHFAHIRVLQPHGPYAFVGFSFGGLVAYEMACLAVEAQEKVEFLSLIDTHLHERCLPHRDRIAYWKDRNAAILRAIATTKPQDLPFKLLRHSRFRTHPLVRQTDEELSLPSSLQLVASASRRAFAKYRPRNYFGRVKYFRATKREGISLHCEPLQIWSKLAPLDVQEFPATHSEIIEAPVVYDLGRKMAFLLSKEGPGPEVLSLSNSHEIDRSFV